MNQKLLTLCIASPLLVSSVFLMSACSKKEAPAALERPVKLMTVGGSNTAASMEFAGDVRARVESNLGFRVNGKIISRRVEVGQHVRAGEELARIDSRDYQLADLSASSQLSAAQAQLDNATADYTRFQELRKKGFVSETDLEHKRVALSAAQAQKEQANSGMALEKNRLGDTVLRADANGVITAVLADTGEGVTAGQPVMRLAQDGAREIEIEFPEDRRAVAAIAKAEASLWALPGKSFPANLRELAAAADPVTRTFRARYTVHAPNSALTLGQSASIRLQLPRTRTAAAHLPTSAIFGDGNQTKVWIYDPKSSQIKQQLVQVVGVDNNEILVAGIASGAQVVVAGVHVLTEGQKVKPFISRAQ